MHSNVTIKNVSWPHFSWATLYIDETTTQNTVIIWKLYKAVVWSGRHKTM